MLLASLRLGLFLTTLVATAHVAATPRFWTLTGVQFQDGAILTGTFSYDDATQTIANWNVRVSHGQVYGGYTVQGFTYVPGNSGTGTSQAPFPVPPILWFSAALGTGPDLGTDFGGRRLQITPLTALDGSNSTVPIITRALDGADFFVSREDFAEGDFSRLITAGALTLTPLPPPVAIVQVDEFYNPTPPHHFITASAAEKQDLDNGVQPGWVRTGQSFKAYATGSSAGNSINPVCRYYYRGSQGLNSHFFSADATECARVAQAWLHHSENVWLYESDNVFQISLPNTMSGACPGGTIPVYRLLNPRPGFNHRYTTSATIRADMLAAGYIAEGYGPDGVVMCALQ